MSPSIPQIRLRTPSTHPQPDVPHTLAPPTLAWLQGSWNVTHSSLPMWRKNRNVRITYTPIDGTSPAHIHDKVTYQPIGSKKLKTVEGTDKPFVMPTATPTDASSPVPDAEAASLGYHWRGNGWLFIASSKWEILGYGNEDLDDGENEWVVTYFAKTLFTPAGIDFYSRNGNLKPDTVERLKAALVGLGGDVATLATQVQAVAMDGERED